MAVKMKKATTPSGPRFDFERSQISVDDQTATLKELLNELNHQNGNDSASDFNLKSLATTLRLVTAISGIRTTWRIGQPLPLATIKTIKLLFKSNQFADSHLIRILELPGENSPVTVDFFTSPATSESEDVKRQISRLISDLEKEIGEDEIALIDEICDPKRLREKSLQDTNEAVDKILLTHIHIDDALIEEADDFLTERTRAFLKSIAPLRRESRLHIATYTYLRLLDYVHRLFFEISTQLTIPNDRGVANKQIDFTQTCKAMTELQQRPISPDTNFMSIDDAIAFFNEHSSDIARLASEATGFKYNKRDVPQDRARALIALQLYLLNAQVPNEHNQKPIGLVHVVAAFCSVLHQRKLKTKPEKNSRRYGSRFSAPQKLLDAYIKGGATHIPSTVGFKYLERTRWYVHALLGRKHKADRHIAVRIAQSEFARDVFMSLDHAQIRRHIGAFREVMTTAAHDFIALYGKEDQRYEWRHGG